MCWSTSCKHAFVANFIYIYIYILYSKEAEYDRSFPIDDNDPLAVPSDVGEYEIKARQVKSYTFFKRKIAHYLVALICILISNP